VFLPTKQVEGHDNSAPLTKEDVTAALAVAMGLFTPAVRRLVALFYHCFNRIVIHSYLTGF
jgi:hypothetical protein